MRNRSWPVLIAGFGILLGLIGLLGLSAFRRAERISQEVAGMHQSFQHAEQTLNEVEADIYISGIFTRDFLLDPSNLRAATHRNRLMEIRSSVDRRLEELSELIHPHEISILKKLQSDLNLYWDVLEPIFEWTPSQKIAFSSIFLRQQVLPRRDAVLAMAKRIRDFNQLNFQREQEKIVRSREDFRQSLGQLIIVALALGVVVATISILRLNRLERRAEEQRRRNELAEEELRRLSHRLVRVQEEERKSISRELHDEVGQTLTAIRMELGNLEQLRGTDGPQFQQHLEEARRLAGEALHEVRNLAMGLRPSMLDDLGLGPAMEWQAREFSRRSGVPVTTEIDGTLDGLPETHLTHVYRIVQEALTNCARHAKAKNIRITLHGDQDRLALIIQDDGIGLNTKDRSRTGLGLTGIDERVRELGGKMEIISQPQKGTLLRIEIPERQIKTDEQDSNSVGG
jgi:signal transduction histidine kinase